jgi:hypothetical protein
MCCSRILSFIPHELNKGKQIGITLRFLSSCPSITITGSKGSEATEASGFAWQILANNCPSGRTSWRFGSFAFNSRAIQKCGFPRPIRHRVQSSDIVLTQPKTSISARQHHPRSLTLVVGLSLWHIVKLPT